MLQELILGILDVLSSQTTKKELIASILLYLLISGISFYHFHEIFQNSFNYILFLSLSTILLIVAFILFNKGIDVFYNGLFISASFLKSIGEAKIKSFIIEYIKSYSEEESSWRVFNNFISQSIGNGRNEKDSSYKNSSKRQERKQLIDEMKMKIVLYIGGYLASYFISMFLLFSTIWTISYDVLKTGGSFIFEIKNEDFLTLLLLFIFFFLFLLTFYEIKTEGISQLFSTLDKPSETNKIANIMTSVWLDSLLWYFTYTYDERKQEWRKKVIKKTLRNKLFGKLYKVFFALTPIEYLSRIKVISQYISIPLIKESKGYLKNRFEKIENRLPKKFSVMKVIEGKENVENNILKLSWDEFINTLEGKGDKDTPISFYLLFSNDYSEDENKIDCVGTLVSFVYNPYTIKETQRRPVQKTVLIEMKELVVYILLIVRMERSEEYERFLATVF